MQTRREFTSLGAMALGSLALRPHTARALQSSATHNVHLGLESYGLMPYPQTGILDLLIDTLNTLKIDRVSLQEFLLLPPDLRALVDESGGPDRGSRYSNDPAYQPKITRAEDALKQWRTGVSIDTLHVVRNKFLAAKIDLDSYMPNNLRVPANSTDADLERACEIAGALGIGYLAVMMQKSDARRFAPIAEKHNMRVGLHGHPNMHPANPDVIATPDDFVEAASWSRNYGIHFDIGNATAGGYDTLAFVQQHLAKFSSIVLKDRSRDGTSKPWGEGDSQVKDILQLVRDRRPQLPCWIDVDFAPAAGRTRIEDIAQCTAYARSALRDRP